MEGVGFVVKGVRWCNEVTVSSCQQRNVPRCTRQAWARLGRKLLRSVEFLETRGNNCR